MTAKKKVAKRAAKKATKKVAKKVNERELEDKKIADAHNSKMDKFGKAVVKLTEKHGLKFIGLAYDNELDRGMLMGANIKSFLEKQGLEAELKRSLGL